MLHMNIPSSAVFELMEISSKNALANRLLLAGPRELHANSIGVVYVEDWHFVADPRTTACQPKYTRRIERAVPSVSALVLPLELICLPSQEVRDRGKPNLAM